MTRLPFGGFDPIEKPIDEDADPGPLLGEIADSIVDGRVLRPALACWFHGKLEHGLVHVKQTRGAKRKDPFEDEIAAIRAIEELQEAVPGTSDGRAIKIVQKELKLKSSVPVIYGWLRWHRQHQDEMRLEACEQDIHDARACLRTLSIEGVTGQAAVECLVLAEESWSYLSTETLGNLAQEVAAELAREALPKGDPSHANPE